MKQSASAIALAMLMVTAIFAQADVSDRSALGRAFLDAFQKVAAGTEVSQVALPPGSLEVAKIYPVGFQTGIWFVHVESGMTVFSIYPYWNENDGAAFGNVVVKVDRERLSLDELLAAFRGESTSSPLHIVEHSTSFPDGQHFYTSKNEANKLVGTDREAQK